MTSGMVPQSEHDSGNPYPLVMESADVSDETGDVFRRWVQYAHQALSAMAANGNVPSVKITAVLATDFVGAVNRALAANAQNEYTVERLGGTAVAKNIPIMDDHSEVHIIFDSATWIAGASGESGLLGLFLAAHEFTHAFIGRLRAASGALKGVTFPSRTPVEAARSIARISTEEFVADIVAGRILATAASVTVDGESRPVRPADLTVLAAGYSSQLGMVLDQAVYPGWPDLVQSYREYQVDLNTMWSGIVQGTDQSITLIAHAEAEAVLNDGPQPLEDIFAEHKGAALYLAPAWNAIRQQVGDSLFPSPEAFRAIEKRITDAGEAALLEMWKSLGLTFEINVDRSYAIHVSEPLR